MAAEQESNRQAFFARLSTENTGSQTRAAIDALLRLPSEEPLVHVEFNVNKGDHSLLVRIPQAAGNPSLLKVESDGSLELFIDLHSSDRVKQSLIWLARRFGSVAPSLINKKPRFKKGDWDPDIRAILRILLALARGDEDVVGVAEGRVRGRRQRPPAEPSASPEPTQSRSPGAVNGTSPGGTDTALPPSADPATAVPPQIVQAASSDGLYCSPPAIEAPLDWADVRIRETFTRWARSRQSQFRDVLLNAYGRRCCVSGDGPDVVLEAAHIDGHAESGDNSIDNGLLLRADLHSLFDAGLLAIHPETLEVVIDQSAASYRHLHGARLRPPAVDWARPSIERLRARWARGRPSGLGGAEPS